MNNEEKIIAMLEKQGKILEEHTKILEGHTQLLEEQGKILEGHTQLLEGHTQLLEEHTKLLEEQGKRLDKVEADVSAVRVLVDVDIEGKLNLLAEGHAALLETLAPKTKTEELEENYVLLRSVVSALARDVAELKKAQ